MHTLRDQSENMLVDEKPMLRNRRLPLGDATNLLAKGATVGKKSIAQKKPAFQLSAPRVLKAIVANPLSQSKTASQISLPIEEISAIVRVESQDEDLTYHAAPSKEDDLSGDETVLTNGESSKLDEGDTELEEEDALILNDTDELLAEEDTQHHDTTLTEEYIEVENLALRLESDLQVTEGSADLFSEEDTNHPDSTLVEEYTEVDQLEPLAEKSF